MNTIDLKNRCTVITGGAAGIGLGIAQRFAASGARVALWDVNESAARDAAAALGAGHLGLAGPPFTPDLELGQPLGRTLRLHLHRAIGQVAHPAAEVEFVGAAAAAGPVAHPLHPAAHDQPPALQGRRRPGFAGLEKAALIGGGAAGLEAPGRSHRIPWHPAQGGVTKPAGAFTTVHLGISPDPCKLAQARLRRHGGQDPPGADAADPRGIPCVFQGGPARFGGTVSPCRLISPLRALRHGPHRAALEAPKARIVLFCTNGIQSCMH